MGGGFSGIVNDTSVAIGQADCSVVSSTPSEIQCITSACGESCGDMTVTSASTSATSSDYSYLATSSTVVSGAAAAGSVLTISGTGLGSESSTVTLGGNPCTVTAGSDTSMTCTLPSLAGGNYAVVVTNPASGNSNADVMHSVDLLLTSLSPATGSFGGGTKITLTGTGFSSEDSRSVTLCGVEGTVVSSTTTSLEVLTPLNPSAEATLACDVAVVQDSGTVTLAGSFTYDAALTPTITATSPARGGTGGGTLVTITGTGFAASGNKVSIDGSICDIAAESATEVTCYTNYHAGAVESSVTLEVPSQGYARAADEAASAFYYIDRFVRIKLIQITQLFPGGLPNGHGEAPAPLWQMK